MKHGSLLERISLEELQKEEVRGKDRRPRYRGVSRIAKGREGRSRKGGQESVPFKHIGVGGDQGVEGGMSTTKQPGGIGRE